MLICIKNQELMNYRNMQFFENYINCNFKILNYDKSKVLIRFYFFDFLILKIPCHLNSGLRTFALDPT